MLNALTYDVKASVYKLLFIDIDTTLESTVHHLLSIIEASWLRTRRLLECVNLGYSLGYLQVSSGIPERNFHESAQKMMQNNTVSSPGSLWASKRFKESWKAFITVSWVTGRRVHSSISCWLHFLIWTIWYWYLYTKNYKAVNTYHRVFCYPECVNTKRENPMV